MRYEINHRIFGCRNIVGTIHIIYIQRLFPRSHQSFIIEWSYFIYFPVSFIRLAASGIVMTAIYPLELSANTISCLLRQTDLSFHQPAHAIFTPRSVHLKLSGFRMQSDASPCTIFSVQQLILPGEFFSIFGDISPVRTTPILDYIPVGSFPTITGSDDTHRTRRRIHLPDNLTTFLCKFTGQCTFILQSPYND